VTFQSVNPTTGEVLDTFEETVPDALTRILERATAASRDWRRRPVAERAERLRAAGRLLRERKDTYARTMALEMGKPLAQGVGEAEKCAWVCDYYAEHGAAFLADEPRPSDASRSYIRFEALGPVLAIMPWNFPFWQVFRFAAPALVAGNAGILKHAPNVPRCAVEIETVFHDAGFPDGLFRAVFLSNEGAGRGERVAHEIEAGSVFVNGLVKSDPRLPFGGVKRSGYGRELSKEGLREFVNVKTVWVA